MKRELFEIKSFDGLALRGYYYEYSPNSPLELIFHGYSGNAERDLSGGVERCFALGRSCILIDQRGSGMSEGKICSFGVNERHDCLSWIEFATEKFGKERPIIIGGISMGAATVMMAAGENLPDNVVCVMADCGYSSPKEIIKKVMGDLKLPAWLFYPFVKLGAKLFGGFDLEETSAIESVKRAKVPVIFIHGEADGFVPCDMSRSLYEACLSPKKILTVPEAGHGIAYLKDGESYLNALRDFEKECGFLNS
jgi:pimeloyl-ACP methyl ester carboxylesterase